MFWTEPEVRLASGQEPAAASTMETHIDRNWRRFSWHRKPWDSARDNMMGFVEFIRHRLEMKQ
jgi:hypothetical protein